MKSTQSGLQYRFLVKTLDISRALERPLVVLEAQVGTYSSLLMPYPTNNQCCKAKSHTVPLCGIIC